MKTFFLILALAFSTASAQSSEQGTTAQQDSTQEEPLPEAGAVETPSSPATDSAVGTNSPTASGQTIDPASATTRELRGISRFNGTLHFSPLSTWLPSKFGFALGLNADESWTWEAEYTSRSISASFQRIDFGKVTDRRYGIQSRWYPGSSNSFHLMFGVFKSEFSAEIGNSIISNMSSVPSQTLFKIESIGPSVGLANRWQWSNGASFGVDWFMMYVPMFNVKVDDDFLNSVNNTSDRSDIDDIARVISRLPQFDILRLNLGYSF